MRARWMPEYVLSEESQRLLDEAAGHRTADAKSARRQDRYPLGDVSQRVRFDRNGFAAEAVVRHHFGLDPMPRVAAYVYAAADIRLHGKLVDVKCTEHPQGLLQRHTKASSKAEAYLLVVRSDLRYTLIGWLPAKELMRDDNRGTGRWAEAWIARQEALRCISTLRPWCMGAAT
jgi:hypothetical protein